MSWINSIISCWIISKYLSIQNHTHTDSILPTDIYNSIIVRTNHVGQKYTQMSNPAGFPVPDVYVTISNNIHPSGINVHALYWTEVAMATDVIIYKTAQNIWDIYLQHKMFQALNTLVKIIEIWMIDVFCNIYIYKYIYSIHVAGWLLKWLNLITAHGSVSIEPGSVTWLATKYLKTVSFRNHTEKWTTLWPQTISFWPKINIPSSYFTISMLNCFENTPKLQFDSYVMAVKFLT